MVNSLNTMMMQGVLGKDMDWKARARYGTCTNLQKTYQRKNKREEKNEKNGRAPVFWQAEMYTKHTKSDTKKEKEMKAHTQLIKKKHQTKNHGQKR